MSETTRIAEHPTRSLRASGSTNPRSTRLYEAMPPGTRA